VRESGHHSGVFVPLAALIAAVAATSAAAQTQERAQGPNVAQACIYRPNIDHTRVLDDRTILFFMRDRTVYQNTLKDQCYSLKSANRFAYGEASLHRICTGNLISVIHDITPGGISQSNLCKLGAFVPVEPDVVDELLTAADPSKSKGADKRRTIQVVPVESPPAEPEPKVESTKTVEPTPTPDPTRTVDSVR
jgi:hypothetical protein